MKTKAKHIISTHITLKFLNTVWSLPNVGKLTRKRLEKLQNFQPLDYNQSIEK